MGVDRGSRPRRAECVGRETTTKLVERHRELAILSEAIRSAAVGRGRLVFVNGEPGIGKSALLAQSCRIAEANGLGVMMARGIELEADLPFGVAIQALEDHLPDTGSPAWTQLFNGIAAPAAPIFDGTTPQTGRGDAVARFRGLARLLQRVAEGPDPERRRGALLAIDDTHWADTASLRFLAYLAERLPKLPIALVVAARSAPSGQNTDVLGRLASSGSSVVLGPARLSVAGVELIVRADYPRAASSFVEACVKLSSGNVFLLHELLAAARSGRLPANDTGSKQIEGLLPESVVASVTARMARLSPEASHLAAAAAVLGRWASLDWAATLAGLGPETAEGAADDLAEAGFLEPGDPLIFIHPMICRAVLANTPALRRSRAHRAAADLLVGAGADPEEVAAHLMACRSESDAACVEVLRRAAAGATADGRYATAASFLTHALDERPVHADRAELAVALALAQAADGVEGASERALEAVTFLADRAARTRALGELGRHLRRRGDLHAAARAARAALDGLALNDPLAEGVLGDFMSAASLDPSQPDRRISNFMAAIQGTGLGQHPSDVCLRAQLARALAVSGSSAAVVMPLAESALRAVATDDGTLNEFTVGHAAAALVYVDAFDQAVRWLDAIIANAVARGLVLVYCQSCLYRSEVEYQRGELRRAISDGEQAFDLAVEGGWTWCIGLVQPVLAHCHMELGDLAAARVAISRGEQSVPGSTARFLTLEARGRLALLEGRPADALCDLETAGRNAVEYYGLDAPMLLPWRSRAALAALAIGERGRAWEMAAAEVERTRKIGTARPLGVALRAAGMVVGGDDGISLLRESATVLAASPGKLEHAKTLLELGAAMRRHGQRVASREPLASALDMAKGFGATGLALRAHEELLASGARPRRAALSGAASLTPSELRIARLVAKGGSNIQIAQDLYLTKRTVEWHINNILRKLGGGERSDIASTFDPARATVAAPDGGRCKGATLHRS